MPSPLRVAATALVTTAAVGASLGAAGLAYAAGYEAHAYTLRRVEVPVLRPGQRPLRVLHVSDLHLTPAREREVAWVRALDALEPDLVINTGDNLASTTAVPTALRALEPLMRRPGAFVPGSNDYYAPRAKNPAKYLMGPSKLRSHPEPLPYADLQGAFTDAGWADLTNDRTTLEVDDRSIDLVGVDDPHLRRDRYAAVSRRRDPSADVSLGVAHAPYRRVLDAMTRDGLDLLLAGHTHGGQLCVPGYGALVTNCDLPRQHVKGLTRWGAGDRETWLHVSAGLGTSPYTPVRFACYPEATLLTLVAGT
jgi:predicted MPP superfamily phosphohydrolase